MNNEEEITWVCSGCGSPNIEEKAWVDVLTGEITSECDNDEYRDHWCRDCEDHLPFVFKEDYSKS